MLRKKCPNFAAALVAALFVCICFFAESAAGASLEELVADQMGFSRDDPCRYCKAGRELTKRQGDRWENIGCFLLRLNVVWTVLERKRYSHMEMQEYIIKYVIEEDYPLCSLTFYHDPGSALIVGGGEERVLRSFDMGSLCDGKSGCYTSALREVHAKITTHKPKFWGGDNFGSVETANPGDFELCNASPSHTSIEYDESLIEASTEIACPELKIIKERVVQEPWSLTQSSWGDFTVKSEECFSFEALKKGLADGSASTSFMSEYSPATIHGFKEYYRHAKVNITLHFEPEREERGAHEKKK